MKEEILFHEKRKWTTVSIYTSLAERIRRVLPLLGYKSLSDFICEAARRRLEELEPIIRTLEKEQVIRHE